jgi:CheY-like chemotaxis protein
MGFFVIRFDTWTLQDVYMPVMNGLQTTKLIRSYEETGNWDASKEAGIEQSLSASDECSVPPKKRIHIVAVSNYILIFINIQIT